ncbi:AraC family transcriptional regulator [Limnobacter humi]|uniref:AraC family transcriptional regulator n=1 Tax=Limnobacter humi TaxID=1778671 RepID=A0ABT1WFA2_9BURK|nr:AraC family transcriptional regulator [Limnobacter humi]MCQ8895731.1 AraC family transcriptional regulator [Limnobacter humi]
MQTVDWALRPALHPVYARLLCAELLRRGLAREAITTGLSVDWEALHTQNGFISAQTMQALAVRGMALTDCPWLGLEVGFRTQAAAHGVLGAAMMASSSLAEAALLLQRYARLRQNLAVLSIVPGEHYELQLVPSVPLGPVNEYLHGQLVAGLLQLFSTITGLDLQTHLTVHWPFEQPEWYDQYQRVARVNVFGAPAMRISLPADVALSPSIAADAQALRAHLQECELALHRACAGESLADRVRVVLESGDDSLGLTLDEVANRLHLTRRTLIRKLAAEGTRFQAIHDELRKNKACWLLMNTNTPVDAVAAQVGCGDASNFSRMFKRWVGVVPSQYRLVGHRS